MENLKKIKLFVQGFTGLHLFRLARRVISDYMIYAKRMNNPELYNVPFEPWYISIVPDIIVSITILVLIIIVLIVINKKIEKLEKEQGIIGEQ